MSSMLPANLNPAAMARRRRQSAEQFDQRLHPFYFKGQIDIRRNYALRARLGAALGELAEAKPRLTRGGMYIATPYQHGDPAHWLKFLRNCSCAQTHGLATSAATNLDSVCINCVEQRIKPTGENYSPNTHQLLAQNPYASDIPETRYGFHISGDLPSSNRLFDILKVGAIPVAVSRQLEMTLPFSDIVPWDDIMIRLPTSKLDKKTVEAVLAQKTTGDTVTRLRRTILKHTPDVLWDAEGTRVTTNILLMAARHCMQQDIPYPDGVTPNKFKHFEVCVCVCGSKTPRLF